MADSQTKRIADKLAQKLEDLIGLARMGAAALKKYKAAFDEGGASVTEYRNRTLGQ